MVAGAVELRVGVLTMTHGVARHAVAADGSVLFLAPPDSPGGVFRVAPRLRPQIVTMTAVDVASVPQHDRVRGSLWLSGPMMPAEGPLPAGIREHLAGPDPLASASAGPVLLLRPTRAWLSWHCESGGAGGFEARGIPVDAYRDASPDPLRECEAQWLPHLHLDHADLLRTLAEHVAGATSGGVDVRPLALDRFGLVLRLYAADGYRDVRLPFGRPVTCGCELREAFTDLVNRVAPPTPGFRAASRPGVGRGGPVEVQPGGGEVGGVSSRRRTARSICLRAWRIVGPPALEGYGGTIATLIATRSV